MARTHTIEEIEIKHDIKTDEKEAPNELNTWRNCEITTTNGDVITFQYPGLYGLTKINEKWLKIDDDNVVASLIWNFELNEFKIYKFDIIKDVDNKYIIKHHFSNQYYKKDDTSYKFDIKSITFTDEDERIIKPRCVCNKNMDLRIQNESLFYLLNDNKALINNINNCMSKTNIKANYQFSTVLSQLKFTKGKWYFEVNIFDQVSAAQIGFIIHNLKNIYELFVDSPNGVGDIEGTWSCDCVRGVAYGDINGVIETKYFDECRKPHTLGILIDIDNGKIEYYKNNESINIVFESNKIKNGIVFGMTIKGWMDASVNIILKANDMKYNIPNGYKAVISQDIDNNNKNVIEYFMNNKDGISLVNNKIRYKNDFRLCKSCGVNTTNLVACCNDINSNNSNNNNDSKHDVYCYPCWSITYSWMLANKKETFGAKIWPEFCKYMKAPQLVVFRDENDKTKISPIWIDSAKSVNQTIFFKINIIDIMLDENFENAIGLVGMQVEITYYWLLNYEQCILYLKNEYNPDILVQFLNATKIDVLNETDIDYINFVDYFDLKNRIKKTKTFDNYQDFLDQSPLTGKVATKSIEYLVSFSEDFELENFPFDSQDLPLKIKPKGFKSLVLSYYDNDDKKNTEDVITVSPMAQGLGRLTYKGIIVEMIEHGKQININIKLSRNWRPYIYEYFLLMFLIALLSFNAFSIDPDSVGDKLGVVLGLILALLFIEKPKIPTTTLIDKYYYFCFGFMTIVSILISFSVLNDNTDDGYIYIVVSGVIFILFNAIAFIMVTKASRYERRKLHMTNEQIEADVANLRNHIKLKPKSHHVLNDVVTDLDIPSN